MAKKIDIEGSQERLKKSVALLWIRRGMADWVVPGSKIARRSAKTSVPVDIRFELTAAPPLPRLVDETDTRMPSGEIPGVRFKPTPAMTQSRLQAKTSQFHRLPRIEWEANLFV